MSKCIRYKWVIHGLPWEESTAKLNLDKDLGVKDFWGRVEGSARNCWINEIGGSNSVRAEESDNFSWREPSGIGETFENGGDGV